MTTYAASTPIGRPGHSKGLRCQVIPDRLRPAFPIPTVFSTTNNVRVAFLQVVGAERHGLTVSFVPISDIMSS